MPLDIDALERFLILLRNCHARSYHGEDENSSLPETSDFYSQLVRQP